MAAAVGEAVVVVVAIVGGGGAIFLRTKLFCGRFYFSEVAQQQKNTASPVQ